VSEYKFAPENRDVAQERFKKTGGAPPQGVKVIGRFAFIGAHSGTPQVSPDGRTLLLVAVDAQGMNMLWLRPLDSLSARPLPGTEGADSPFWSADGLSIGFFANGKLNDLRLSPDGQRVAYSNGVPNSDIWIRELKRDAPMRLTFDPSVDKGAPVWSPDGNEVLFDIAPGGKNPAGIYRKSSSGTGAEELLAQPKEAGAGLWPTDWSRNGQFILCVQGEILSRNSGEIWVLPASAVDKPRVFVHAPGAAYDGQFSPDGHWVAYVSKESGREEVYVVPFDGNQVSNTPPLEQVAIKKRWQVSAKGGAFPRWRRDGKELFYVAPGDGFTAIGIEVKGSEFSVSDARPLFKESLAAVLSPYDVRGDGQRFLANGFGERGTLPLTLVANWKELLMNK